MKERRVLKSTFELTQSAPPILMTFVSKEGAYIFIEGM